MPARLDRALDFVDAQRGAQRVAARTLHQGHLGLCKKKKKTKEGRARSAGMSDACQRLDSPQPA